MLHEHENGHGHRHGGGNGHGHEHGDGNRYRQTKIWWSVIRHDEKKQTKQTKIQP